MSGMEPLLIGSAIGAATSKNPLQGALMGGMLGGAGGAFMSGAGGLSSLLPSMGSAAPAVAAGANTAAGSGLLAGSGQAAANLVGVPAFGQQAFSVGANAVNPAGIFAGGGTPALGGITGINAPGATTGLINSSIAPSFMESVGQGFQGIGNYAQQNPNLTQMGLQSAQQMMQQPQTQFAPAGQIQRGGIQDVQIASALPQAPRISLI
jgi:hypothetical protein